MAYQETATYILITSIGYCSHVSGGIPSYCWNISITSIDICESYCTNQKSCVGYDHSVLDSHCELFTSDSTCPSDFKVNYGSETFKTMKDLVAVNSSSFIYNCYGKTSGKRILHFCTLDIVENSFQLTCNVDIKMSLNLSHFYFKRWN